MYICWRRQQRLLINQRFRTMKICSVLTQRGAINHWQYTRVLVLLHCKYGSCYCAAPLSFLSDRSRTFNILKQKLLIILAKIFPQAILTIEFATYAKEFFMCSAFMCSAISSPIYSNLSLPQVCIKTLISILLLSLQLSWN